jgi:hypothetical protein
VAIGCPTNTVASRQLSFAGHQHESKPHWALIAQLALDVLHCPLLCFLRPTNNILSNRLLSFNPQQSSMFVITWFIRTRQDKHVAIGCPTNTVASRQLSFAGHQHESKPHWALIAQLALDVHKETAQSREASRDDLRHQLPSWIVTAFNVLYCQQMTFLDCFLAIKSRLCS